MRNEEVFLPQITLYKLHHFKTILLKPPYVWFLYNLIYEP